MMFSRFESFSVAWAVIVASLLALLAVVAPAQDTGSVGSSSSSSPPTNFTMYNGFRIPTSTLSAFGSYPNPLHISESDRASFHPIMYFPLNPAPTRVMDLERQSVTEGMSTPEQRKLAKKESQWWNKMFRILLRCKCKPRGHWAIGRYDENRAGLYGTEMFEDTEYSIDGYAGKRTLHLGVDFMAPVGEPIYSFSDGVVHSSGYNPELGDYGNVIVIEHHISGKSEPIFALYGHMDGSVTKKKAGRKIKKGDVIGRIGDVHENGGWIAPHVHFQLSIFSPETHDMPGAAAMEDRPRALIDYPDPRIILGEIF
jgi:peptidoglycan LD-endopeptidase LytH